MPTATKTGGVAFPCGHEGGQKGMTLRDYFAAHAPRKPWAWFKPEVPPRPASVWHKGHPGPNCYDCSPENWQEQQAWRDHVVTERDRQWPYFYADVMLVERSKGGE